ncbi:unnamed protein product [Gadus morhua 'NCC']
MVDRCTVVEVADDVSAAPSDAVPPVQAAAVTSSMSQDCVAQGCSVDSPVPQPVPDIATMRDVPAHTAPSTSPATSRWRPPGKHFLRDLE